MDLHLLRLHVHCPAASRQFLAHSPQGTIDQGSLLITVGALPTDPAVAAAYRQAVDPRWKGDSDSLSSFQLRSLNQDLLDQIPHRLAEQPFRLILEPRNLVPILTSIFTRRGGLRKPRNLRVRPALPALPLTLRSAFRLTAWSLPALRRSRRRPRYRQRLGRCPRQRQRRHGRFLHPDHF